jgi:PhoH-like ATPase
MNISPAKRAPKLFVLDTNVILHDAGCIRNFEENDIAIPITVLEELDRFKKGNDDIHFQAREFLRSLDGITGDVISEQGASLGAGLGAIRVVLGGELEQRLKAAFLSDAPDHRILNTALLLQRQESYRQVVMVTKDTNLRMKAKALGVTAQDYTSDKVESVDTLYTGKRVVENMPSEAIDAFYNDSHEVACEKLPLVTNPKANENFVLRNGSKSVLAAYRPASRAFVKVNKVAAYGIKPRNSEQSFALCALLNQDIKLVTLTGKAGSGKTLLALAAALECRATYRQILLARPTVPLSNRDLGYLPGDVAAKLDPYMKPLHDNLTVIRHELGDKDPNAQRIGEMLEAEKPGCPSYC